MLLQSIDALRQTDFENLALWELLANLVLAVLLGQVLAWHFVRYAQVLANKRKLARVLVYITATTLLIITVVKSSFALSLGLVGALSIIRFRTPVKEPEELAYLFLAIAVGVGLGANRIVETVVVFAAVLLYMAVRQGRGLDRSPLRTVLEVISPAAEGGADGGERLRQLLPVVERHCQKVDLRRVDCTAGEFHASLLVEIPEAASLAELLDQVQHSMPGSSVSAVERDGLD